MAADLRRPGLKRDLGQKSLVRSALESPPFVSIAAILLALMLIFIGEKALFNAITSNVIEKIADAILTAGTFGILFEYLSKVGLIKEVVNRTVGQCESISMGVGSITDDISEIDERAEIFSSTEMVISSRYSASFLENNRQAIYKRLCDRKLSVIFIRMADSSNVPHSRIPDVGPDMFFKRLAEQDQEVVNRIAVYETNTYLVYNFVRSDDGIWIKLYLNEQSIDSPPAFYVIKGSPLYNKYSRDIDLMLSRATRVPIW